MIIYRHRTPDYQTSHISFPHAELFGALLGGLEIFESNLVTAGHSRTRRDPLYLGSRWQRSPYLVIHRRNARRSSRLMSQSYSSGGFRSFFFSLFSLLLRWCDSVGNRPDSDGGGRGGASYGPGSVQLPPVGRRAKGKARARDGECGNPRSTDRTRFRGATIRRRSTSPGF